MQKFDATIKKIRYFIKRLIAIADFYFSDFFVKSTKKIYKIKNIIIDINSFDLEKREIEKLRKKYNESIEDARITYQDKIAQAREIEQKILRIQFSKKTTFKWFLPLHQILRQKYWWYYKIHTLRHASKTNWCVFAVSLILVSGIISNGISDLLALQKGSIFLAEVPAVQMGNGLSVSITSPKATPEKFYLNSEDFKSETDEKWIPYYFNQDDFGDYSVYLKSQNGVQKITVSSHEIKQSLSEKEQELIDQENKEKERKLSMEAEKKKRQIDSKFTQLLGRWIKKNDAIAQDNNIDANFILKAISLPVFQYKVSNQENEAIDVVDEVVVILNETEWSEESQVSHDEQENTEEENQEQLTRDPSATPQDDKNNIEKVIEEIEYEVIISEDVEEISDIETEVENVEDGDAEEIATPEPAPSDDSGARNDNESENENIISRIFNVIKGKISSKDVMADEEVEYQILDISDEEENVVILNETEWSEESQVSQDEQENTVEESQERLTRDPSATPQDDKNNSRDEKNNSQDDNMEEQDDKNNSNDDNLEENKIEEPDVIMLEELEDGVVVIDDLEEDDVMVVEYEEESAYAESYGETKEDEGIIEKVVDFVKDLFGDDNGEILNQVQDDSLDVVDGIEEVMENINTLPVEDTNITEPTAEEWQDYEVDQTTIELEILEQTEDYIIILQKFVLMDKEYNRFDAQVSVKLGFDGRNYINEWEFSLAGEGNNNSRLNRMYWDVVMEPQEENSADNSEITENNADVKQEVRVKKDGGDDGIATPTARNDNGAQDDSVKELPALKQKIGDVVVNVTDFVLEEAENDSVEVLGVDNWILNQVQDDNMDEQENLKELNMAVIDQEPIITEEAVALIEDENIIRVEHIVAPSSVNRTYFYPDGKAGDLLIDPVLSTSYTGGFATITIQADDGDEADDFKIIFSEADGGASTFQRGQAGGTWATNVCSATTLLTELDQDSDIQTDQTGVMQIIEANATRVVIRNDFTLGSEASTTEEYIIYPSGKIYKNVEFNKSLAGTEARLFFNSANLTGEDQHLAGWHPSTPSTSRGVGTYNDALLIELMSTSTTAIITDYQAPGTPTMTTGTLETTATTTGDFDSDGFNEGFGTYEITATTTASSTIQMRLDGSSTNKYDPSFHVHDFYPRTSSSTLQNEYYDHVVAHYRLDDDAANTAVRDYFNNTNINDGVSSGNTSALTSVISNRGSAFLLDDNGDQFHASSTMLSDWSQGTIEFWYRPNYAFAAAQPAMKFLFGTVATGTANNIYAFVYDDGSTATLEFGLHGATNISTTTITETDDALWPANGWTHLKFIWDETSTSTTAVYVNGEKPTQTTTNNSPNLTTVGENIVFGDYQIGGSYSAEGIYDEVKIYNDAMLPYGAYHTDFVNNYSKPHPDVIFYDGLDSTSDDADYSAGSATRTESGTSATTTNVYENAMEFNASGDYQSFATTSNISNSKGSIGMWVKSTDATNPGSNQYLFFADANFNIFYDAFGQINFQYDSSATSTDETDTYDNAWHWVRATWDYDNDNYAIYVDGARQDSDTTSLSAPTLDSDFYVGNNSTPNSNFNGSIDEIFITSSNMTPQISTAFGKPIRQPQLSIDGLQVVGTDYNISNANSPSDYIIQYLGNITTNAYIDIMETAFPMYSNGTGGGTWSNSNAWGGTGNTPSASSTVIILDGDDITFNLDDGATSTTCSDITINSGAELNFATTTAADYRMNVYGDINVDGYFFIDASSNTDNETTVSLINESSVEHGIIVGSTGKLEILGESTVDRDAFVTSYVNDGSHNAYIYCQDGSECSIKFSDISYLGSNSGNRYGIYAYDVDSSDTEYFYADGNEVHHGYQGFHLDYSSSNVIKNNNIYSMTNGITLSNWSNFNLIKNNNVHSNSNLSIYLAGSSNYNSIKDNIIYDNVYGVYFNSSSNDYIVNNTIDSNQNYGVSLSAGADDNIIKNNIISNHPGGGETGISDGGSGTITSHNLFYNNTATGTPGDYATYADPDYTSTTTTSDDFMYVNVDSAALGAGVDIVASSVPGTVNIGARLGYVKNQTDSEEFNAMQHAHDDASLGAGDTVTTYTIDNATSTLSSTTTVVGLYEYFTATDNIIATNDDYVGHYVYMSSGLNRGRYYLIVDTIASSETIYILSKDDDSAFINGDGIIIIDRVYTHIGDSGNSNNVRLSTDGTPTSPITWNTNGTVIVDGENMIDTAIYLNTANYNIINEFNATNCTDDGIMMHLCSGSKIISNNLYNNDNNGLYMNSGSYNYVESNLVYDNGDEGIVSSGDNLIVSSNNSYNNFDTGCYFSGSSDCILKSNSSFANGSRGFDIRSGSNNNEVNNNLSFKNSSSGFYIHDNSDDNYIYNNISLYDTNAGVVFNLSSDNNNIARNNIITNAVDGIDDNGSGNTYDYNYFFNNTENIDGGGAIGNNSITGMDPYFYAVATGTNETAGLTTHIYDSSLTIDENDYVGYGVKITGGTGNGQFAGITSNSASRFFVAPAFTTALGADSTFEITDFTITATSSATTPLGQGCNLDDDSEPGYINIGAKMGYIVNDNAGATSTKYSSLQQTASSTSDLDGGDIITVYATQEATGSFLENPTNFGTYATTTVATSTVPSPDDYIGMYMLMTSGAKK
ncbi:MAG: right-handed parallel beta-helix repeat-containing protein, partial [Candidatus Falkowbacteria bacterium]